VPVDRRQGAEPPPCGTEGRFLIHCRARENCTACRTAHEQYIRKRRLARLAECHGTRKGYDLHLLLGEHACPPCLEACRLSSQEQRDKRQRLAVPPRRRRRARRTVAPCGTDARYRSHLKFGEQCAQCQAAHDERVTRARLERLAGSHGTTRGYSLHRKLGQGPCSACREAVRIRSERYRAKTREPAELWITAVDGQPLEALAVA
jgi:hypothetical protein